MIARARSIASVIFTVTVLPYVFLWRAVTGPRHHSVTVKGTIMDTSQPIDFSTWSDQQLEIGLCVAHKAGRRSAETRPLLIAEMERRGLDTTDHDATALVDAFLQDLTG